MYSILLFLFDFLKMLVQLTILNPQPTGYDLQFEKNTALQSSQVKGGDKT